MSKTRRKVIRTGICGGRHTTNTKFYHQRRIRQRRINNQRLKAAANAVDLLENYSNIEDVDNIDYLEIVNHDSYREPTDGTTLIMTSDLPFYDNDPQVPPRYASKIRKALKPKHYKH